MVNYLKSHPWLTFQVNFERLPHSTWVLLGEAETRCKSIRNVALKPDLLKQLHLTYLAKGIHATTAIEGNALSEEDVKKRISEGLKLPDSMEYQGREVDNILRGYTAVRDAVVGGAPETISVEEVKTFNRIVLDGLPAEEHVVPGEYRKVPVGVFRYIGAPPEACPELVEKLCDWLNHPALTPKDNRIIFGILRAVLAHLYIAWIHPFGDGNGRTARFLEFKILLAAGAPGSVAPLLSNHYNRTRSEYYRQLDQASKSGGDVIPFINYAIQGFVENLREQSKLIHFHQLQIFWRDLVYQLFGNNPTLVRRRRRNLALRLADNLTPATAPQLLERTEIKELYLGKTLRTLQRDIDELKQMQLILDVEGGYLANFVQLTQNFILARRQSIEDFDP